MAERQHRNVDQEERQRTARSRWLASAAAKAERLAHWQLVDQLYQSNHWQGARPKWRPDPVLNYTFHVVEEHRGQLAQIKPEPVLTPRRPTDDKKTNVFKECLKYGWQRARIPYHQDLGNLTFLMKGTWLAHVFWNPTLMGGTPEPVEIMDPTTGQPVWQAAGTMFKGDWDVRGVDPAHFFVDPGLAGPDLQDAAWCGVGELKLLSQMRQLFPHLPADLKETAVDVIEQGYVRPSTLYTSAPDGDKYCYAFEMYEKLPADREHQARGYRFNLRKSVYVNWVLVDEQDYYYRHSRYPFVPQHNYIIPGQFWAMGDPQAFMALERLIRKIYEQVALGVMLTVNPQRVLNPHAGLTPGQITSEIGKVYLPGPGWNPATTLQNVLVPVPVNTMPPHVLQFVEMLKQDISTLTSLFQGLPAGVTAASAVIAVFERLAARIKRKAEAASQCGQGIVEQSAGLISEFYTEERVFRLTQPIDGIPWGKIRGSEYADLEYDIDMDMGASAPLSKALMAEQASSAYKSGALRASEYLDAIDFPRRDIIDKVREREQRQDEMQQMQANANAALLQGVPGGGPPGGGAPAGGPLPPGINLEGAPPQAKSMIMNRLGDAGRA